MGEVARVLRAAGRPAEAAELMLATLAVSPDEVGALAGARAAVARRALELFDEASSTSMADRLRASFDGAAPPKAADDMSVPSKVRVFGAEPPRPPLPSRPPGEPLPSTAPSGKRSDGWRSVGAGSKEHDRTIQDLEAAGRFSAAARVAWDAKLYDRALAYFVEQGAHYEAGMVLADAGRPEESLRHLVAVLPTHKRYRAAACRAVELAVELERFDFDLDKMVAPFSATPPTSKSEVRTYLSLARTHAARGFAGGAVAVLEKVLEFESDHPMAQRWLEQLDPERAKAHRGRISVDAPALPGLPDLASFAGGASAAPTKPKPITRPSSLPPRVGSAPAGAFSDAAPRGAAITLDEGEVAATVATPPLPRTERGLPPRVRAPLPRTSHGPPVPVELATGEMLAGRYEVISELGEGGMARVYKVLDHVVEREVALKVLHQTSREELWAARFRQELALARDLSHKNIVRVYDLGTDEGRTYMTMELLEGRPLDDLLLPVPTADAIRYGLQVSAALGVAHQAGIVHRDIKLSNLFVSPSGHLKIMDFGIAKAPGVGGQTGLGMMIGTPEYASPEQCLDASSVTPSADLYSLGVCLYELLTGEPPFMSEYVSDIIEGQCKLTPSPPSDKNAEIPRELEELILRLLAKHPRDRYETTLELSRALRGAARALR